MTKKMICVYASNNLSDAVFKIGEVYEANRDEDKKVFITCPIGMNIQVKQDFANQEGNWVYHLEGNGTYRFSLV